MSQSEPTTASIALRTIAQATVFWSVFLFLIPALIDRAAPFPDLAVYVNAGTLRIIGSLIFLLGASLGITSATCMVRHGRGTPLPLDPARRLVIVGPYRWVRNPMAIAGLAQAIGVGIYLGSAWVTLYALAGGIVWDLFVRPWEERDLQRRFGGAYNDYRGSVRCWVPRRPRGSA